MFSQMQPLTPYDAKDAEAMQRLTQRLYSLPKGKVYSKTNVPVCVPVPVPDVLKTKP